MYPALVLFPSDLSSPTVPRSVAQYVNHLEGKSGQVTPTLNSHSRALLCLQDVHMKRRAFVISQMTSYQSLRSLPRSGNTKTLEFPVHPPRSGFFFLPGFLPSYFSSQDILPSCPPFLANTCSDPLHSVQPLLSRMFPLISVPLYSVPPGYESVTVCTTSYCSMLLLCLFFHESLLLSPAAGREANYRHSIVFLN